MRVNRQSQSAGFTLVEMLVVIVIIGILAAILLPAVGAVKKKVIDGRMAIDISHVEDGFQAYKEKNFDYPPNAVDANLLKRHILKVWPKINNAELAKIVPLLNAYLDPAEAIPLWLGGFSGDARRPFLGPGGPLVEYPLDSGNFFANPERNPGLLELDKGDLTLDPATVLDAGPPQILGQLSNDPDGQSDSFPVYVPKYSKLPLVYFDSRSYGVASNHYPAVPNDAVGAAKPYLSNRTKPVAPLAPWGYEWINEKTFQIIGAGRDGHYGCYAAIAQAAPTLVPRFPDGANYDPTLPPVPAALGFPGVGGDNDNITNFSGGNKLEDAKP